MRRSFSVTGLALALTAVVAGCSTRTVVRKETETTRQAPPRVIEERTTIQQAPPPQVEKRSTTETTE
jgi:hypothetical protein